MTKLNKEQSDAIVSTCRASLVLSGAGTGKTSTFVARVAHIIREGWAHPWEILAMTFTNKAAKSIEQKIKDNLKAVPPKLATINYNISDFDLNRVWKGTFHSICLRILRYNAERAGLRRDFLIYGEDEQKVVLKTVIANLGLDTKEYEPGAWVEKISAIKDNGLIDNKDKIFVAYNAELARLGAVDFEDLILRVLQLFKNAPDVLQKYQKQFKYIMVDEFQDTNSAQYQLIKMLAADTNNIWCVGDDDQSIYSWRGAEIKNILEFEKTFPGAKIIRLETNYRSTANILGAANSLIKNNNGRLGKDLRTNLGDGEKVYVMTFPTDWDEKRMIADAIRQYGNYSDIAILVRAGSVASKFEDVFTENAIPYRLIGETKFYDRTEIKDAIAYIRLLVHSFDDMSFLRVIGRPRRGFGDAAVGKLRGFGDNLMAALRATPLSGKQRIAADEFLKSFDFDWAGVPPVDAAEKILNDSGYIKMWQESKDPDASDRLMRIKELLVDKMSGYDTLPEFLEHAALMTTDENDVENNDTNVVSIMTIHAAKGLEFDTVFMPAWEEGIFPNEMSVNEGGLEEERRLAYVAITRAKRRAIISNAMSRTVFGERKYNAPSRFIAEIDSEYIYTSHQDFVSNKVSNKIYPATQGGKKPTKQNLSSIGKLVSHNELGRGVVIEDNGDILTVAFRDRGIKKVAKKFLEIN